MSENSLINLKIHSSHSNKKKKEDQKVPIKPVFLSSSFCYILMWPLKKRIRPSPEKKYLDIYKSKISGLNVRSRRCQLGLFPSLTNS